MITQFERIDKITDKIFLGDLTYACKIETLKNKKISSIISLCGKLSPKYSNTFNQKIIYIEDLPSENIIQYFKECIEFIEKNKTIYIHCLCGISRSPTIVIAYLMWKKHSSYFDTFQFVKKIRNSINPNGGFTQQLKIFDKLLKDNKYDLSLIDFTNIKWRPARFII